MQLSSKESQLLSWAKSTFWMIRQIKETITNVWGKKNSFFLTFQERKWVCDKNATLALDEGAEKLRKSIFKQYSNAAIGSEQSSFRPSSGLIAGYQTTYNEPTLVIRPLLAIFPRTWKELPFKRQVLIDTLDKWANGSTSISELFWDLQFFLNIPKILTLCDLWIVGQKEEGDWKFSNTNWKLDLCNLDTFPRICRKHWLFLSMKILIGKRWLSHFVICLDKAPLEAPINGLRLPTYWNTNLAGLMILFTPKGWKENRSGSSLNTRRVQIDGSTALILINRQCLVDNIHYIVYLVMSTCRHCLPAIRARFIKSMQIWDRFRLAHTMRW